MLPEIITEIPGPKSKEYSQRLSKIESRNITFLPEDLSFPIFWESGENCNIWDNDGNRFLDLTSAFGVSSLGHSNPKTQKAIEEQSKKLIHGMGDLHPPEIKVLFLEKLISFLPRKLNKAMLSCNGSDACESALKTTQLYTKKPGFISFENSYHGLGYGALDLTEINFFRTSFQQRLSSYTFFAKFPDLLRNRELALEKSLQSVKEIFFKNKELIGGLILEPIQGRGGVIIPPKGFLKQLKAFCEENKLLFVLDEIYTGFGRTGKLFAFEYEEIIPDLLCLGKTLGGGLPLSVCVGKEEIMQQAWPKSKGEAIHTSTFLGNPTACATGLATLQQIQKLSLGKIQQKSDYFQASLRNLKDDFSEKILEIRAKGLMLGVEFIDPKIPKKIIKDGLKRGLILLSSGKNGQVLSFSPPLIISQEEIDFTVKTVRKILSLIN